MTQSWLPQHADALPNGLILFDGVYVLCSRSIRFVLEYDSERWFCFTPIQSAYGRVLAAATAIASRSTST